MPTSSEPEKSDRRDFLKKACCVALGGTLAAVPAAAGVGMYLDPLLRTPAGGTAGLKVRVTTLDALPGDGVPRQFKVMASQIDGWTKTPETAIGAVFLIRGSDAQPPVRAFNVACPHAGCFVEYVAEIPSYTPDIPGYFCPCHNSTFKLDGQIAGASSPAPRGLDELECFVQNGNEVWVLYQNFQAGTAQKVPLGA
jgi:menaquinol-cytochrome c reductase iron-sulfur subunit